MLVVMLGNLLDNALRYAGRGATFRVVARREGETVVLEVSDDGAGVDASDVPRLFERFFRSDRSRTTRGTGLGLAIVKHIVGAAEGTAEVDGALGEGTRFRFVLPAAHGGRLI
jgi:two-component system phosphate regulon sensor histidine kinase PhoR